MLVLCSIIVRDQLKDCLPTAGIAKSFLPKIDDNISFIKSPGKKSKNPILKIALKERL